MQMSLTHVLRYILVIVLSVPTLSAFGCRSTRSGLSQLPGMAWVAPSDAESLADWSDAEEPSLPPPSSGATPQLTTKSGTSALESPLDSDTPPSRSTATDPSTLSHSDVQYPDTGYPALQQPVPAPESLSRDETPTTDLTGPTPSPGSEYAPQEGSAVHSQPQRGFYGSRYDEQYGSSDSRATSPAESISTPPSRYSDGGSRYSRYGDLSHEEGVSRYGTSEDLPPPGNSDSTPPSRRLISDADSGYEPYGERPAEQPLADAPDFGPYQNELAGEQESENGLPSDHTNGLANTSGSTDAQHSGVGESGPATYGAAYEAESLPSPRARSNQPWRPGSTTSYPTGDLDQTRYSSDGARREVAPASYPSTADGQPRFAPQYR